MRMIKKLRSPHAPFMRSCYEACNPLRRERKRRMKTLRLKTMKQLRKYDKKMRRKEKFQAEWQAERREMAG